MAKQIKHDFIIIDDDSINNMICAKIISKMAPESDIKTFTDPEAGFDYICSLSAVFKPVKTILFLDINMPDMTGWEFMERFDLLERKDDIQVYILSSSVDESDKRKAKLNKNIKNYIVKPLHPQVIENLIESEI